MKNTKQDEKKLPFFGDLSFDDIIDMVKETKSKELEIEVKDDGNICVKIDGRNICVKIDDFENGKLELEESIERFLEG